MSLIPHNGLWPASEHFVCLQESWWWLLSTTVLPLKVHSRDIYQALGSHIYSMGIEMQAIEEACLFHRENIFKCLPVSELSLLTYNVCNDSPLRLFRVLRISLIQNPERQRLKPLLSALRLVTYPKTLVS